MREVANAIAVARTRFAKCTRRAIKDQGRNFISVLTTLSFGLRERKRRYLDYRAFSLAARLNYNLKLTVGHSAAEFGLIKTHGRAAIVISAIPNYRDRSTKAYSPRGPRRPRSICDPLSQNGNGLPLSPLLLFLSLHRVADSPFLIDPPPTRAPLAAIALSIKVGHGPI